MRADNTDKCYQTPDSPSLLTEHMILTLHWSDDRHRWSQHRGPLSTGPPKTPHWSRTCLLIRVAPLPTGLPERRNKRNTSVTAMGSDDTMILRNRNGCEDHYHFYVIIQLDKRRKNKKLDTPIFAHPRLEICVELVIMMKPRDKRVDKNLNVRRASSLLKEKLKRPTIKTRDWVSSEEKLLVNLRWEIKLK